MNSPSSCKCLHCREFFIPCPNSRHTQRYCGKSECRKASKAAAQAKWLNKPQNRSYFHGPENVERVQRWRERHPGYWRKKRALKSESCLLLRHPAKPARLYGESPCSACLTVAFSSWERSFSFLP